MAFFDVELSYLMKVDERSNHYSGFEVHREYVVLRDKQWVVLEPGNHATTGELVLVNIYLNNRFDRHHVVLEDSVPGGLEPIAFEDIGWGRESIFNFTSEFRDISPTSQWHQEYNDVRRGRGFRHRELGQQKVLHFADSIRRGKYRVSWIGRAITSGEFTVLPTHVEEVYRPIMFDKSEPWTLKVEP